MKKFTSLTTLAFIAFFICACGGKGTPQDTENTTNDSLINENALLNDFIDVVAGSMDSIALSEGYIFEGNVEGTPQSSQKKIKERLATFEDLLKRQKERIAQLEKTISNTSDKRADKLRKIIKALDQQIEEKNAMIAELRKELGKKNVDISKLQKHVSDLNTTVSEISQASKEQEEALIEQTNAVNEAYLKVGSKKELKRAGLLTKKKLNVSNIDVSLFEKIDMREFEAVRINGKKPKVLTHMPASSYKIEKNSDGTSTLIVTDPSLFWSVSSFLVIQTN